MMLITTRRPALRSVGLALRLQACVWTVAAVCCSLTNGQEQPLMLEGKVLIRCDDDAQQPAMRAALRDVCRDFERVLGVRAEMTTHLPHIMVQRDRTVPRPEAWCIDVDSDRVTITGQDMLGMVYGLYNFSREFLGVDPYWFWKDQEPKRLEVLTIAPQIRRSANPTFRYRGWVIGDEDLLSHWHENGGRRYTASAYAKQIVDPDIMERVHETALRADINTLIPASCLDVMNPPEAYLAKRAAERGLYVSQPVAEPLGVSRAAFSAYWGKQGRDIAFSYIDRPRLAEDTWALFAQRWHQLCGDQVIWQVGLPPSLGPVRYASVPPTAAVLRAIRTQWDVVRTISPRGRPVATAVLPRELSETMLSESAALPEGPIALFVDDGMMQLLQRDFLDVKRRAGRSYGVFLHVSCARGGPHLIQGTRLARLRANIGAAVAKGDVHCALIHVGNIREHILGIQAASEMLTDFRAWGEHEYMNRFAPAGLQPVYSAFLASLVPLPEQRFLHDSACAQALSQVLRHLDGDGAPLPAHLMAAGTDTPDAFAATLKQAVARLDDVTRQYAAADVPADERAFFDVNVRIQASLLRCLYAALAHALLARADPAELDGTVAELEKLLALRQLAEAGKWQHWYRGDSLVNVTALTDHAKTVRDHLERP